MKVAVRYYTKSGNTRKLAEAIAKAVGVEARSVDTPLEEKTEVLFLGSSVYAAGVDAEVKKFLAANKDKIGKIANFSTAALLPSTYKQVKSLAEKLSLEMTKEEFHCRGSFLAMHKGRPNEEDCKAAAAFAKNILGC